MPDSPGVNDYQGEFSLTCRLLSNNVHKNVDSNCVTPFGDPASDIEGRRQAQPDLHGIQQGEVGSDLFQLPRHVLFYLGGGFQFHYRIQNVFRVLDGDLAGELFDGGNECRAHAESAESHS